MRRTLVVGLLVSMTLAGAFAYRVHAQQEGRVWPPVVPSPGTILIAEPVQPPGPVYIVTFVDITPNNEDAGTVYCKQYVADTRKDPGITSVQLLAQTNRPSHLVIYEVWQNEAAYERHTMLAHTEDFHAKMMPIIESPFDEQRHYVVP